MNPVSIQTANANRGAMAMPKAVTIQPISCQEEYNKNNGKLSGQCCKEMFQVFEQTYASSLSGQTQARLEDDQIVAAHLTINVMGREGAHTLLSTIINDHFVVINQSDLHIAKKNTPGSNHLPGASMPVASPITIERVNNNVALLTRAIQVHDSFIDTKNNKNAKMKLIDAFKVQNFQTANMYLDQIREQARANYDKVKSLIIPTKDKGSETSKNSSKAATAKNEFNNNIAALGQRCPDYTFTITLDPNILPLANSPQPMGGGSHRPNARDISRK
ncbi:MAG: hypothetical protein A2X86_08745 [Bdellovibrionales bacterium GWA2_49_15]|nr:MAG: hypothetical protein A2X86_08745 [Bdellovibrionales bacterium GWA2_49_15]HAZ13947.1 hypothetical protein [Bdellovibrionales bacterium]